MGGGGQVKPKQDEEMYYDWLLIELFDQMVRIKGGGEMLACFNEVRQTQNTKLADIIKKRVGDDILAQPQQPQTTKLAKITKDKIFNKFLSLYLKTLRALVPRSLRDEVFIVTSIGERHKWMYDAFSLYRLLDSAGFRDIKVLDFKTSSIPNFETYLLDINA